MGDDGRAGAEPRMRYREVTVEVEMRGRAEDGTVAIAISSEEPVERDDWGTGKRFREVLGHRAGEVDLSRARDGLPFLLDHNQRAQIGLVENVRLGADGKLRGVVRPGSHPDATWAIKDMRDGIRKKVSVGYDPGDTYTETFDESLGMPVRRYTGWKPMEASSVAVPADYSVGVGRSAAGVADHTREREAGMSGTVGVNEELARRDSLRALARAHKLDDRYDKWVAEGVTVEAATREALDALVARAERAASVETPAGYIDFSERERRSFSICRLIAAAATNDWSSAGLEQEAHRAMAKRLGREHDVQPGRALIPMATPLHVRASVTGQVVGTASLGGSAVQTTVMPLIEMLKNLMVVKRAGARVLSGLRDNLQFPRQITANQFNWVGENPSSANTLSALTFDTVTMSPKVGMVSTAFSRLALIQPSFDMEQVVIADIASQAALGYDLAALHGTGTGQPRGIFNTSGVNTVTFGTGQGAVPTRAKLLSFASALDDDNAPMDGFSFITTPGVKGVLRDTLANTISGANYLWSDDDRLVGYPAFATKQISSSFTTGTTAGTHGVVGGNFSELLLGEWGGVGEVLVDPLTLAGQNMIGVHLFLNVDAAVRHPVSFCISTDARLS